jgi:hypothetical protein
MKQYVENCINSFDDAGDCVISQLPHSTTSDFADGSENAKQISKDEFYKQVLTNKTNLDEFFLVDDVYIGYNSKADIQYFFSYKQNNTYVTDER